MVERVIKNTKRKSTGIILAIFFNFFAWTYTWKFDKSKFWGAFILNFIGLFTGTFYIFIVSGTFLWCLIDMISKDNDKFENYGKYLHEDQIPNKKNSNNKNIKTKKIEPKKGMPTAVLVLLIVFVGLPVLMIIIALIVGMSSLSPLDSNSIQNNDLKLNNQENKIDDENSEYQNLKDVNTNDLDKFNYSLNESFEIDNFEITINDVKFANNIYEKEDLYLNLETDEDEVFVVLNISIKNKETDTRTFYFWDMELLDNQNYSYNVEWMNNSSLDKGFSNSEDILPGKTKRGEILFTVDNTAETLNSLKLIIDIQEYFNYNKNIILDIPYTGIWFSTTEQDKPLPDMELNYDYVYGYCFDECSLDSITLNIENNSNFDVPYYEIEGKITNKYMDYFEKEFIYSSEDVSFGSLTIEINESNLDESMFYKVDANLMVDGQVVDTLKKNFNIE